jgi:hypothetical protein
MKLAFLLSGGAWASIASFALLATAQYDLTGANSFGTGEFESFDVGGGTLPPSTTPCIGGSCVFKGQSEDLFTKYDLACDTIGSDPLNIWKEIITQYECIPQGYPNYVYAYSCADQFIGYCLTTLPNPKAPCPSGGCTP